MQIIKWSSISILSVALLGCNSVEQGVETEKRYTQADLDLMLENAKASERSRMQKELNRQIEQKRVFDEILARQKRTELAEMVGDSESSQSVPMMLASKKQKAIQKIIPTSKKPVVYKVIDDKTYYRCAANSLVATTQKQGVWQYKPKKRELSATLCKMSRDKKTIKKLQERLFNQGYLTSNSLTKEQLVDGVWGEITLVAVKKYQLAYGLLFGQMTIQTLEHIGVFKPKEETLLGVNSIQNMVANAVPKKLPNSVPISVPKPTQMSQAEVLNNQVAINDAKKVKTSDELENVLIGDKGVKQTKDLPLTDKASVDSADASQNTDLVKVVAKIVPDSRKPVLYQRLGGASYFRCAANALVAEKKVDGKWVYGNKRELSATLCKASRDQATMTDLQYELYEKGFLRDGDKSKNTLVDGGWGKTTLDALKKYQEHYGLLYGQLTIESLEHIGVFEPSEDRVALVKPASEKPLIANDKSIAELKSASQDSVKSIKQVKTEEEQKAPEVSVQYDQEKTLQQETVATKKKTMEQQYEEVKFVALNIQLADAGFDASTFVPKDSKPQVYAYVNRFKIWRCGARSLLAESQVEGAFKYGESKAYRATLCKSNRTIPLMTRLQTALRDKGYLKPLKNQDRVVIDGIWGARTLEAVKAYQAKNGLAYGQLTIEVLEHLGVFIAENKLIAKPVAAALSESQISEASEPNIEENAKQFAASGENQEVKAEVEDTTPEVTQAVVESTNQHQVKFVPLKIKLADAQFNAATFVPENAKPKVYAYVNRFKLWRCGARSLLPEGKVDGVFSYGERKEYRATLCKLNRTIPLITRLQTALRDAGYLMPKGTESTVEIDGIWGSRTLEAVKSYQQTNGLAYGQLTIETLEHLGVFVKLP